ncbi:uncharacterized protein LOC129579533 [Sitodiplosis mosellana]|uniref:uncharacterized protein LOC129579533 n=1 Tax=Sitodiplosis mosellana TaxID=263140 RepID=UPI0024442115|nr:uncharacterized protein LOC129579533 [Sitodiplosis mosellana]
MKHTAECTNACSIEMPDQTWKWMKFDNYKHQLKAPFVVYADTEAYLKGLSMEDQKRIFSEECATTAYQQHHMYSVGYYFKCEFDDSFSYYRSSGNRTDSVEWFITELKEIAHGVARLFDKNTPMLPLTEDDRYTFHDPNALCTICGNIFEANDIRVHDHCHLTGRYRGPAHQACNLQFQDSHVVPVIMHNLSGYDSHLFIKKLSANNIINGDVSIIPANAEQYIAFTKVVTGSTRGLNTRENVKFKFIDSYRFMPASLAELASLLPADKKQILYNECEKNGYTSEQISMLERKGVFPYEYLSGMEQLKETNLPLKADFYSKLNGEGISDDDYQFAHDIWQKFNCKTLGDYSELYLKTDVLLLADVFENFRNTCHTIYSLDPANYYTAPGLSWDAMLKYTGVRIELLSDVEMLLFIERGIRGGISQCSKRQVKANNKYMGDVYNDEKPSNYLMYLDANNLYGHAMSQPLPLRDFKWIEDNNVKTSFSDADEIAKLADDSKYGYIFEVDLQYPKNLHAKHNDFPFCPEKRTLPQEVLDFIGIKPNKIDKLLLTLYDKENYIIHYRMLKLALQHGLVLKKVHRVLQFEQNCWLKSYININTQLRTQATNDFEKSFFKYMINAVFGKTMENLRLRADIKLVNKWGGRCGAGMFISRPNVKKCKILDEDLAVIELQKTHIKMNKPIIIGMSILDISKITMYSFLYDFLKPKYGKNCTVAYTDTDSFILSIQTDDFYNDMKQHLNRYDTSDYPENNVFKMPQRNKKVPGIFKDELNGEILAEFVGLRAKCYAVLPFRAKMEKCECPKRVAASRVITDSDYVDCMEKNCNIRKKSKIIKKSKGIKKNIVKRKIAFSDYVDCIEKNCNILREQHNLCSKSHQIFTIKQKKIALNPFDDKRYLIRSNGIDTLAWGHHEISEIEKNYC